MLDTDDLVGGDDVFFAATGVTDGDLLDGVRYLDDGHATTESLVMRSRSGTVRRVQATHDRPKLREVVGGYGYGYLGRALQPQASSRAREPVSSLLVPERVDHRAGEHYQADRVEPDQGDEDEADRSPDPVQVGDVVEVEGKM